MPQEIPFESASEIDQFDTDLDGRRYRFVARWNERAPNRDAAGNETEGAWFLSIFDEAGRALICGVRVSTGVPLARWLRHPLTQAGCIIAADTSGKYVDPSRYDLGARVKILHYPEDEIVAAISEGKRRATR